MQSATLDEEADFGKLPFDIFVLERWDYSRAVEQDQQQWDELARAWLAMDAPGRHPYHELSRTRPATPTAAETARVLAPHQTVRERNLSLRTELGRYAPVWLRTCYSPELAEVYASWRSADLEQLLGHWSQILDDEAVYAPCVEDWSRVLLRVPAIVDTVRYVYETDVAADDDDWEPPGPGEEYKMPVFEAKRKEKTMMFLIDEEALRSGLVKILWLDIHGECVWENRLDPHKKLEFVGRMHDGGSLGDLYEDYEDEEMYEWGAVLDIN
ncbi:hypothetical protein F4821DRAFT_265392 [Hypoxylon rubiginosum]|uniref:Uncharacterized protein n=1 Tax=Hypoxylon rubiginosum TaxID=110542 RepID=A0ACC0CKH4_9PEZI|nr:hypothetical protein F4821DRAFT_265392 [Hypoxylon rubiginosum]